MTLIESHTQAGGCAGTFKRKNYIFDVGATQVAGLEKGGIHSRIFDFLDIPSLDCLLYTSDAADDSLRVDLGGRRIIKKMQNLYPIEINEICEELGETYPKSIEQVHGGDIHCLLYTSPSPRD